MVLFLTAQKGSNEFLEVRTVIPCPSPAGVTQLLLLWDSPELTLGSR